MSAQADDVLTGDLAVRGISAKVAEIARDRDFGQPVARYRTKRLGRRNSSAATLLLNGFGGFWQRFCLYENGMVCVAPDGVVAVPWNMVDHVRHQNRITGPGASPHSYWVMHEALRLMLRPGQVASAVGGYIDLSPVRFQGAMTKDVRRLVCEAGHGGWVETEVRSKRAGDGAATALVEKQRAESRADQAARAKAAKAALAERLHSYRAGNAASADDQAVAADREFARGRIEPAFNRLLGVIEQTSGEDRDRARLHLLSLLDAMPPEDPRVAKTRATLSRLIF